MMVAGIVGVGFYFRRITGLVQESKRSKRLSEPAPPTQPITASFRDPAGSLFRYQGRVLRVVNAIGAADLEAFLASPSGQKLMAAGTVVPTRALDAAECRELLADPSVRELYDARGGQMILEHERVDFPSFPYEWNAEMLHAAGLLTLDLAQALLADGLGLKDGTPYNILFRGPAPVFIDVLSFERRQPGDATWLPYAQFVRTFLLPLLANQAYGLGLDQILTTRRDGLEPEEVYRWSKPSQRLRPPFFSLVSMPTWLGGKHKQDDTSIYQKKLLSDPEKARFILDHMLNGLRRTLQPPQAGGGQELRVVGLHDHQQQLHGGSFPGQAALRGRGAGRISVALRAGRGLQHGPLQRDRGAQRRQSGGGWITTPSCWAMCGATRARRSWRFCRWR